MSDVIAVSDKRVGPIGTGRTLYNGFGDTLNYGTSKTAAADGTLAVTESFVVVNNPVYVWSDGESLLTVVTILHEDRTGTAHGTSALEERANEYARTLLSRNRDEAIMSERVTESWADLADWTVDAAGGVQVSANKLYNNVSGNGVAVRGVHSYTGKWSIRTTINNTGTASGLTLVGVNYEAADTTPDISLTDAFMFGIGNNGYHYLSPASAYDQARIPEAILPEGELDFFMFCDGKWISGLLTDSTHSFEAFFRGQVPPGKRINNIEVWNSDSRALSGNSIGSIIYWDGGKILASEHTRDAMLWSTPAGEDIYDGSTQIRLPAGYDSTVATPVILYHHGVGGNEDAPFRDTNLRATTLALLAAGYVVASSDAGNDLDNWGNWGNQAAIDSYLSLYKYVHSQITVSGVLVLSQSMGGLTGLLSIAAGDISVDGWAGIYPACNLADMYTGVYSGNIDTAYSISGDYAAKTAGHDPLLLPASSWSGVPMRFYASPSDTVVDSANNSDAFSALVAGDVPESTVVAATGDHGDASHFQNADLIAFFARCLA